MTALVVTDFSWPELGVCRRSEHFDSPEQAAQAKQARSITPGVRLRVRQCRVCKQYTLRRREGSKR